MAALLFTGAALFVLLNYDHGKRSTVTELFLTQTPPSSFASTSSVVRKAALSSPSPMLAPRTRTSPQCACLLSSLASTSSSMLSSKEGRGTSSSAKNDTDSSTAGGSYYQEQCPHYAENNSSITDDTLVSAYLSPMSAIWKRLESQLVPHATEFAFKKLSGRSNKDANVPAILDKERIRSDFEQIFRAFTMANMRKGLAHPVDPEQMKTVVEIIHKRLMDPANNPPLRIMAFGGSAVQGWLSHLNHWEGEQYYIRGNKEFAWPARLEAILNDVVFQQQGVVEVLNMGVGGTCSDVASILLEYNLFPKDYPGPDIVLHCFSSNDSRHKGLEGTSEELLEIVQMFVDAHTSTRCDGTSPMLVMYDDYMGIHAINKNQPVDVMYNIRYATAISQVSSWYNLMFVSYPNAFRNIMYADKRLDAKLDIDEKLLNHTSFHLPMTDWRLDLHPPLLYHSTAPWLIIFQFLNAIQTTCEDAGIEEPELPYEKLPDRFMPPLTSKLFLRDIPSAWREREQSYNDLCKGESKNSDPCPLKWVVSHVGGIFEPHLIKEAMDPYFVAGGKSDKVGWYPEGSRNDKPRPGWIANATKAVFTLAIPVDTQPIRKLTLVSMKSYGKKWKDSRLKVSLVVHNATTGDTVDTSEHYIDGMHNEQTSVYFKNRLKVGKVGNLAVSGTLLRARFELVGGNSFRINAMLFCSK